MNTVFYELSEEEAFDIRLNDTACKIDRKNIFIGDDRTVGTAGKRVAPINIVKIAMPVNLRRFFPSDTLRNFITMVYPGIDPRLGTYTFEEVVTQTHNFMRYYINEKFLRGDITTNAATQTNPFIRIVPLFLKDFIVSRFYASVQDKNSSAGLTNMGLLAVPEDMKPHIERFDIYMGQPFSRRTNCAIITYEDILTINFASSIVELQSGQLLWEASSSTPQLTQ